MSGFLKRRLRMFKKINSGITATILALVLAASSVPAVGGIEAQAATKTKVLETKVSFSKDVSSGDDSCVSIFQILQVNNVKASKIYNFNMTIYVPASYMEEAELDVEPEIAYCTAEGRIGYARNSDREIHYDINSSDITKIGDFYAVEISTPIDVFYNLKNKKTSFPEGKANLFASVSIVGSNLDYTGSLYIDDISLSVNGKAVGTVDYEDGEIGKCSYRKKVGGTLITPKIVSFDGNNSLTVSKTALSVKKGNTVTIKSTAIPSTKTTFTSSNKKVATVTSKGVVKGVKKGKATITVKANGKTVEVKVTVK
jgi:hypothetical protein